jgi:hypothetical protein
MFDVAPAWRLFPNLTAWIAFRMGFTLPSNFFFSVLIAALASLRSARCSIRRMPRSSTS